MPGNDVGRATALTANSLHRIERFETKKPDMHHNSDQLPTIKVVYYTHPLCVDSWAMQPCWDQLIQNFGELLSFHFCMTSAPTSAEDAIPAPGTSAAKSTRDVASLAVKAAALQSQRAADLYLAGLRRAAMAEQQDISRMDILVEVAREVSKYHRNILNLHQFGKDFDSRASRQALYEDQQKIRLNGIRTVPTLTFTLEGKGIKVSGVNSYERLTGILAKLSPDAFNHFKLTGFNFHANLKGGHDQDDAISQ
nr:DsbA family protein [uncultured Dyadobacter sp.]